MEKETPCCLIKTIDEVADIFQQIMLDVLQRRAVWEALEGTAVGKVAANDATLVILAADYVGSQLSDLRKYFDTDNRVYQIAGLTKILPLGSKSQQEHVRLFAVWRQDYQELANQYYFHRQRGYINPGSTSKSNLNRFIEEVNLFLDTLIKELCSAGHKVAYTERQKDKGYIKDVKDSAADFFDRLG